MGIKFSWLLSDIAVDILLRVFFFFHILVLFRCLAQHFVRLLRVSTCVSSWIKSWNRLRDRHSAFRGSSYLWHDESTLECSQELGRALLAVS